MKSTLHAHQVIGTSWMLGRELGVGGPQGGILADEMGMGKTLQTLACIVSNQPSEDDLKTYCRTTLIVAPATAIDQWESEAKKHVDIKSHTESILHYKRSKKIAVIALREISIILVSYQELSKHFPNEKIRDPKLEEHKGDLLKLNFWRVVLDESHNIKNRNSQMSLACQELNACCRWALSGTPITNSIEEIYPYLKFLKAEVPDEFGKFRSPFMNIKDDVAMQRLTDIVEPIMLRRTMNHTFMGRPLYSIPKPHYDVKYVELTKEERIIYNAVESRFREIINEMLAQKGYIDFSKYLLLFMGLRQAVAHPFMLETTMKNLMTTEDLLNIQRFGRSQFGYKFDMSKQIENALAAQKKHVCRICYQEPVNPQIAACNHAFCRECLLSHIRAEYGGGSMVPKCFECKKPIVDYEPNMPSDEEISDLEGSVSNSSGITIFRGPKLGRDRFKKHPKLLKSSSMFLVQCDQAHPEPVVSSTKTTAVKATILEWKSEAPDDKIIIFVEFKTTAAVLGRMLDAEGIPFLYFFGDMTSTEKDQAIRAFHEKEEITVMIASLKCASVALNITVANRVVLVDLWWNIAVEMQAFGRVFRLGQTKEIHFRRIVADLTIDNRLLSLQERKVKDISKIIKSGGKQKLSLEETLSMFGRVKKSESGVLQVLSDEIDSEQDGTEEEGSDYQYESDEDSDN
ncbi:SNF2 family N-terminal domain-containing protein [Xylaria arbuscula]|nr:SNF2 family N-terminal domain-containing protein [Xylaria arbuscula]